VLSLLKYLFEKLGFYTLPLEHAAVVTDVLDKRGILELRDCADKAD
jgi:hypothetical protein